MNEGALGIILITIVSLSALIWKYFKPRIKGQYGELKVSVRLKQLNSRKYRVLNNVLIESQSRSSQIDHLVISNYGVFVIETKNYKGWIFGHESSRYWTQVIYKNKYQLRNPILQSWGHVNTVRAALSGFPSVPYYPIVVFTGTAKLKRITSSIPVIKSNRLIGVILKHSAKEYLSNKEVDQIYFKMASLNIRNKVSRKTHVRKAKANQRKNRKPTTCPRCGGRLSVKEGKFGKFYGCSNFPNCRYTKSYGG